MGVPDRRVRWLRVAAALLLVLGVGTVADAEPGDPSAPGREQALLPNGPAAAPSR
jgi:hypothetical protein